MGTPTEIERRFAIICAELAGTCTARAAAAELGLSEARYFVLRQQVQAAAHAALAPKPPGRPAKPPPHPAEAEVQRLQAQLAQAELDRECADVRMAIALAMPEVVARVGPPPAPTPRRQGRKARRQKGGSSGHR